VRDRPRGVTASRIQEGAAEVAGKAPPRIVLDVREAIRTAFHAARPGDAVVLGCASHLDELRDALAGHAEIAWVNVSALDGGQAGEEALDLEEAGLEIDA
jgi:hypothetical protein